MSHLRRSHLFFAFSEALRPGLNSAAPTAPSVENSAEFRRDAKSKRKILYSRGSGEERSARAEAAVPSTALRASRMTAEGYCYGTGKGCRTEVGSYSESTPTAKAKRGPSPKHAAQDDDSGRIVSVPPYSSNGNGETEERSFFPQKRSGRGCSGQERPSLRLRSGQAG